MPAIPFIVAAAVDAAIGEAVAAVVGETILGSTALASAAEGAIIGGVSGGISAGIQGGNIGKGMLTGAIGGGVGGGVTNYASGELNAMSDSGSMFDPSATNGGAPTLDQSQIKGLSKGAGGMAGALATGKDFKTSAMGGLISGGTSYLFDPPAGASKDDQMVSKAESGLASSALNQLLSPQQGSRADATTFSPSSGSQTAGSPGSSALSQVLNVGDASGPVLGGSDKDGTKKNVWNVDSLKYMGNQES